MNEAPRADFSNQAVKFIEQGHVRVGPDTITDPAYLVTRSVDRSSPIVMPLLIYSSRLKCRHMEDFVTWVDTSKLKRTIMRYNDEVRSPGRWRDHCIHESLILFFF
jgi:U3 small nucleolar ribonucleoprotein protein IMP3